MIGAIAILLIAYWFYRTAVERRLPAAQWIVGGVLVYYLGFAAWMYGVMQPVFGMKFKNHDLWLGLGMDISAVVVGALAAYLFRRAVMLKRGETPYSDQF